MNSDLDCFLSSIALTLLHSLWQVALLGVLAAFSLAMLRTADAWLRHAVGMGWLLAMGTAPALTWLGYMAAPPPAANAFAQVPSWTDWILPCVSVAWLAGVLGMLSLRWAGLRRLDRMQARRGMALPATWQARVEHLREALGIARTVRVLQAGADAAPFTAYVLRPVIWIPLGLLTKMPAEQLAALLAHELAHVRRLDWIWNLLQHGIETLLFHHPAVWWLSRRIREERELACDAIAGQACGDPLVLAEALAQLQRHARHAHGVELALAAGGGALQRRVAHLLDARPRPARRPRVPALALLVAVCGLCLLAGAIRLPFGGTSPVLLVNLQVRESTGGTLAAGGYRDIRAAYLFQPLRRFRVSVDAQGRPQERYWEDGTAKPVDDQVRAWVAAMAVMHGGAQAG